MYKFENNKDQYKPEELEYIYSVGSMIATKETVEDICSKCSISRRTYFYWKKRFKEEIKEVKKDELLEMKDIALSNIHGYMTSSNEKLKKEGTEMYTRLLGTDSIKEELSNKGADKDEINTEDILKELGL
ncbi:helix-turn-helix domain-containing protein [Clostridium celatum]|uniref:helix-turn-helix domain-containing protein n=1 Tax=Clostridium celatum TaxID=36834 RepID=UPI001896A572|nr:helix-turn-helix domain-containing protein [Clostridium celatum]